MNNMYYYGCANNEKGHDLRDINFNRLYPKHWPPIPWGVHIDGDLAPRPQPYQKEGVASIHHKDGWTALAFWDRSVDTRPGSNSCFLIEGIYIFEEMLELAKKSFPSVLGRFKFEIKLNQ